MKTENLVAERDGIYGKLFWNEDERKDYALIILQGPKEDVFLTTKIASLYAGEKIPSLALFYFGYGNLNPYPSKTPIELIERAIKSLKKRGYEKIGIYGSTFSGELALIATVLLNGEIDLALSINPYTFITGGGFDNKERDESIVTINGMEIPFSKRDTPLSSIKEEAKIRLSEVDIPILIGSSDGNTDFPFAEGARLLKEEWEKREHTKRFELIEYRIDSNYLIPVWAPGRLIKTNEWPNAKNIERAAEDFFEKSAEFLKEWL